MLNVQWITVNGKCTMVNDSGVGSGAGSGAGYFLINTLIVRMLCLGAGKLLFYRWEALLMTMKSESMIAEIPFGIIAVEIIFSERGCSVACRIEAEMRVQSICSGDCLGHQAERSIGELLNAPQL